MSAETVFVVCLLLALMHNAGARCVFLDIIESGPNSPVAKCPRQDDDVVYNLPAEPVHLEATPNTIVVGQTELLTINCSVTLGQVSNMSGITSLIVSKSVTKENQQQEEFLGLVSVNVFTLNQIKTQSQFEGSVAGQIDNDGVSFVKIEWSNPTDDQAGLFRCEVYGLDNPGYPTQMVQTKLVTLQQPNLEWLAKKVRQLQIQIEHHNTLVNNQTIKINEQLATSENNLSAPAKDQSGEIDRLLSLTQTQFEIIKAQKSQLDNQSVTIAQIQEKLQGQIFFTKALTLFHIISSPEDDGPYYLLSKIDWTDSKVAAKTCKDYGGYLAQINNDNENKFVKNFLNQHVGFTEVLINGTDLQHEGRWTYIDSDTDLVFYDWKPGQPDKGQSENCITMYREEQWRWYDDPCTHNHTTWKFLCELENV